MKRLIEFDTPDGPIWAEVDEPDDALIPTGSSSSGGATMRDSDEIATQALNKANFTFNDAIGKVKPIAEGFIHMISGLTEPPSEMTVEFSLKLSAKAGVIVTSASLDANYTVTLTWKRNTDK